MIVDVSERITVDRLRNAEDDGVGDRDAVAKLMMGITGGYC